MEENMQTQDEQSLPKWTPPIIETLEIKKTMLGSGTAPDGSGSNFP